MGQFLRLFCSSLLVLGQSVDQPKQSVDPNAEQPNQCIEPTALQSELIADQHAASHPSEPALQPGDVVTVDGTDYVIYPNEVRGGGDINWITCNPGNIRSGESYGAYAGKKYHSKRSGAFAIFPDEATGLKAIVTLLHGYGHVTIEGAMCKYAPKGDHNDPVAYARYVAKHLEVPVDTYVDTLTAGQMATFADRIKHFEGAKTGSIYTRDDPKLPEQVRRRLH